LAQPPQTPGPAARSWCRSDSVVGGGHAQVEVLQGLAGDGIEGETFGPSALNSAGSGLGKFPRKQVSRTQQRHVGISSGDERAVLTSTVLDHAAVIKEYGKFEDDHRYSPSEVLSVQTV